MSTAGGAVGNSAETEATPADAAADTTCAACGKTGGDELEKCTACETVRYCDVGCRKRHRNAHEKECRRLEREAKLDAAVAAALAAREECPICCLTLPLNGETKDQLCCGKLVCCGCFSASVKQHGDRRGLPTCPFCRSEMAGTDAGALEQLHTLVSRGDPHAMHYLAKCYLNGECGLRKDERQALELIQRAADLDYTDSIQQLSEWHREGLCGLERDEKKAREYSELAASKGELRAHFSLGMDELRKKEPNYEVAMYYSRICASCGYDECLRNVKTGYMRGYVSKDEFAKTLRAYQHAQDEMRSTARDSFREYVKMKECEALI